jgi:hypothetical protein
MNFLRKFLDYGIFCFALFLVFLIVFERSLALPALVAWLGHWHPVILHFPIVMVLVTILQYWRKDPYVKWYLGVSTLLTLIAAVTGFLLSMEGGEKGKLVLTHQWLAIALSLFLVFWYWMEQEKPSNKKIHVLSHSVLAILLIVTGHFGGMLTHGENFISLQSSKEQAQSILSENPNIYRQIIQPILDSKCVSCHNANKSKGKLVLTDHASLKKGGESGTVIDTADYGDSFILKAIHFPLDHDHHMPPKEEEQLGDDELILLTEWVKGGASEESYFNELEETLQSYGIIQRLIADPRENRWNGLPEVSDDLLTEISSNYLSISRMFSQTNALQVTMFPHGNYKSGDLKILKPLTNNVVELNLKGVALGNEDVRILNSMDNLEVLDMSQTSLDDEILSYLTKAENLRQLKMYDTKVSDASLVFLRAFPRLEKVFIYHTEITDGAISNFMRDKSGIQVVSESVLASSFNSVLPSPMVINKNYFFREPFKLFFDHPLRGIDIFYKDSNRGVEAFTLLSDSIVIGSNARLKFYAAKEGWESSPEDSLIIYRSDYLPDSYILKNPPESKYPGRGPRLLFDLEKGPENYGDSSWMAFRNDIFSLTCTWDKPVTIRSVVMSTIVQTDPYLFPPGLIVVKGGESVEGMKILGRLKPTIPAGRSEKHFEYLDCSFDPEEIKVLQIDVTPLQKIPVWHQGKGEKAWFFIDEVVLQ